MPADDYETAGFTALLAELDTYISFFKRRLAAEQLHTTELDKIISSKTDQPDFSSPKLGNLEAYRMMREALTLQIDMRRQWSYAVRAGVLDPLISLRDLKERVRRRIRDEIKTSRSEHEDYKSAVARLKRTYERRCEEVFVASGVESPPPPSDGATSDHESTPHRRSLSASDGALSDDPDDPSAFASQPYSSLPATLSAGSVATSSTATPSTGSTSVKRGGSIISGATSASLKDVSVPHASKHPFAKEWSNSKHQLNMFINKLGKGGGASGSGGGDAGGAGLGMKPSQVSNRLRVMRKEAEEADGEYRKAVWHLETLRLQRERVLRSALASLLDSTSEVDTAVKTAFLKYGEVSRGAAISGSHIEETIINASDAIRPENDTNAFFDKFRWSPQLDEPIVLYENYQVGPCKSLLFGVALDDYYNAKGGAVPVPLIVQKAVECIEQDGGLNTEGIYRISAKMSHVQSLAHLIEKDEAAFRFDKGDVHSAASLLKLYLRQLPSQLLQFPIEERLAATFVSGSADSVDHESVLKRLRRMSPAHYATLKYLCEHLHRVAKHSANNKMTASNLGLLFSPVIFSDRNAAESWSPQTNDAPPAKDAVLENLITHCQVFFGSHSNLLSQAFTQPNSSTDTSPPSASSNLNPPTPTREPAPAPPTPPRPSAQLGSSPTTPPKANGNQTTSGAGSSADITNRRGKHSSAGSVGGIGDVQQHALAQPTPELLPIVITPPIPARVSSHTPPLPSFADRPNAGGGVNPVPRLDEVATGPPLVSPDYPTDVPDPLASER